MVWFGSEDNSYSLKVIFMNLNESSLAFIDKRGNIFF